MRNIELDELKVLQMDVMQAVHDYCEEHHLKYSLACGSLLGAIRHNGYIPWDDDIDIYMPRKDYDQLIEKFPAVYQDHFELISLERDKRWYRPYANVFDNRTVYREKRSSKETVIGVNIDIFPVDAVPDDDKEWRTYNKRRRFLLRLLDSKTTIFRLEHRSILKNIMIYIMKLLLLPISTRQITLMADSYVKKYNNRDCSRLFENVSGFLQKNPFDAKDFSKTEYHVFEDRKFKIMQGYDDCLTKGFGNYMQLPPEKDRYNHHYYIAYWKE